MNIDGRRHEDADGQLRVRLGPVERWVIITGATVLLAMCGFATKTFADRLDSQGDTLNEVSKQQAVANAQLTTLSLQIADVPGLTMRIVELEGQVKRNTDDLRAARTGVMQQNSDDIRQLQERHK